MTEEEFAELVSSEMEHEPTFQQRALIGALARFCGPETPDLSVFLLNGYAGTGKTSVVGALVKALVKVRRQVVLLAPTGRAAKVLGTFAGRKAFTIHRKIYKGDLLSTTLVAGVAENRHKDAVFIVDEASMIGDSDEGGGSLLDDLAQYVYGSGDGCRMILLGDTAQLPPVGCDRSPAMSVPRLKQLGLRVSRAVVTQTVRQTSESGILYNATQLRKAMASAAAENDELPEPEIRIGSFKDVRVTTTEDLEDDLGSSYSRYGIDETILITRSNKRAMLFNLAIRSRILEKEEVLTRDEPVMISKNNYFWTSKIKGADFIANGDIARVSHIYGFEQRAYLRFADVRIALPDRDLEFDAKLLLTTLTTETAGLSAEQEQMLLDLALKDVDSTDPYVRARALKSDPYYNALRVKYAYAITCHKAQGGQWESVFIDMSNIQSEAAKTIEFYRWLYTATTRATESLTYIAPTISVK